MELISEIRTIYENYASLSTEILAASIRTVNHVKQAAMIGADVATVPPAILKALVKHPLTDKGLEQFTRRLEKDRAEDLRPRRARADRFAAANSSN